LTALRALLAAFWLLLSLTATVPAPATAAEVMPCHDMGNSHKEKAPATSQSVMPCCSQPVLPAPDAPITLLSRPVETARLTPAPASPLANLPARLEPRPPKTN